ncbi:hypothetical protein HJC99_00380 [Candidatus Saccharibacteria bacterium]|nr:hypothetical protein [Candidatus Saccharibacteria bacterium]
MSENIADGNIDCNNSDTQPQNVAEEVTPPPTWRVSRDVVVSVVGPIALVGGRAINNFVGLIIGECPDSARLVGLEPDSLAARKRTAADWLVECFPELAAVKHLGPNTNTERQLAMLDLAYFYEVTQRPNAGSWLPEMFAASSV